MEDEKDSNESQSPLSAKLMEYAIKARKVFITGSIDQKMAKDVVQQLHILASINDDPIYVFVSSPGGHVESGDMIFDTLRFISPRIIMIGSGWVASAGALIYVAADKQDRYSLPNTRFLLHQPSGGAQGPVSDIEIYRKEIMRMKDRLNTIFSRATGHPVEKIDADTQRDFWLGPEEAVEYGLVNKIIVSEKEIVL